MAYQPVPNVTAADVTRILHRDFPGEQAGEVEAILAQYGTQYWHREVDRVRIAALRMASGDLKLLRQAIDNAKHDYRDLLATAEYPRYARRTFELEDLPPEERDRIIDADWQQYHDWFAR
jgi:hypothetical protein